MFSKYIILILFIISNIGKGQVQYTKRAYLMGSDFSFTVIDKDSASAERNIHKAIAEISNIENKISEWRPDTQISEVNRFAGIRPVKVDQEVFDLTKRALFFSKITNGAFDISVISMDKIWKFDGSMDKIPSQEEIRKSIEKVGYQHIRLDSINSTIFLELPGMKIGFGSIGKGYAADRGKTILISNGVTAGIVNASGDMSIFGKQLNGENWKVGIQDPKKSGKYKKILSLKDISIATSGDYQKYAEIGGTRYSHIINPKTGFPSSELTSVTVIGPNTEIANGISTSIMVLGKDKGLELIKMFPNYKCILITHANKIIKSK